MDDRHARKTGSVLADLGYADESGQTRGSEDAAFPGGNAASPDQ